MNNGDVLDRLLGIDAADSGCERAFALMDRYAEAEAAGRDAATELPEVATHVANCSACREDLEALRAALLRG